MKICLLPGHAPSAPGTCLSCDKTMSEHRLAGLVLPAIADHLRAKGHTVVITERAAAGGSTPSYSALAANATGADIAVELHFNSSDNHAAHGAEWVYFGPSAVSRRVASLMLEEWCLLTGFTNRGPLPSFDSKAAAGGARHTTNGYNAFAKSKMRFFMAEPFFGSNANDQLRALELIANGDYAAAMAAAILRGLPAL